MKWQRSNRLFFLLVIFILAPLTAGAEMLSGAVVSIDREQGTFVLRTDRQGEIQVRTRPSTLPRHMTTGKQIRIWGEYSTDRAGFTATDIRGQGMKNHHDQTGVRARIGRGKYCRQHPGGKPGDAGNTYRRQGGPPLESIPDTTDHDTTGGQN